VDLGPISKAQVKAITLDEPAGGAGLELDLDLDLEPGQWLSSGVNVSQTSAADITLPDMGAGTQSQSQWEEEDPLLFGPGPAEGDNPLDVNYDLDMYEAPEEIREGESEMVEDVEVRRDSDSQNFGQAGMMEDYQAPEIEDFEMEQDMPQLARPSMAHSELPTPGKSGNDSGMLDFDTPNIEVKKSKKRRPNALDENIELPKATMRMWVMEPAAIKDSLRESQSTVPKTAEEARRRRKVELARKGKLADVLSREPLSALIGPALVEIMASMPTVARGGASKEEKSSSRKRKSSAAQELAAAEAEKEGDEGAEQQQAGEGDDVAPYDDVYEHQEYDAPQYDDMTQNDDWNNESSLQEAGAEEGGEGAGLDSVFGQYVNEEDEEEEEDEEAEGDGAAGSGPPKVNHGERTKKVIVMLQQCFAKQSSGSSGAASRKSKASSSSLPEDKEEPLEFQKIIRGSAGEKPSKHTAAVAFFELLGLQAKGLVELGQDDAFGEISIGKTNLLVKAKV